jgi:hypothetical protein
MLQRLRVQRGNKLGADETNLDLRFHEEGGVGGFAVHGPDGRGRPPVLISSRSTKAAAAASQKTTTSE